MRENFRSKLLLLFRCITVEIAGGSLQKLNRYSILSKKKASRS